MHFFPISSQVLQMVLLRIHASKTREPILPFVPVRSYVTEEKIHKTPNLKYVVIQKFDFKKVGLKPETHFSAR